MKRYTIGLHRYREHSNSQGSLGEASHKVLGRARGPDGGGVSEVRLLGLNHAGKDVYCVVEVVLVEHGVLRMLSRTAM